MKQVEFRFLQKIVSHISGDRVTLGLLHWDGQNLRHATSFSHLSFCDASMRDIIKRTVSAKIRAAAKCGREAEKRGYMFGLKQLVPVREGLGASLYWSPIQSSRTHDPEAHFEHLKSQIRRRHEAPRRSSQETSFARP